MAGIAGRRFVCSWSGGKDSALALQRGVEAGGRPVALLTMLTERGARSRSHGLRVAVLQAQAAALGLPLVTRAASWDGYSEAFAGALRDFAADGVEAAVFGDIDVEGHRGWVEDVCARSGLEPVLPLWGAERSALLEELFRRRFEAVVVAVERGALEPALLGRRLDRELAAALAERGVDPCGELGEYHTLALAGPPFAAPLGVRFGRRVLRDGYWFLDMAAA